MSKTIRDMPNLQTRLVNGSTEIEIETLLLEKMTIRETGFGSEIMLAIQIGKRSRHHHIDKETIRQLLPFLEHFVEHGKLPMGGWT